MKHLRTNFLLLVLLASATNLFARPYLHDLNILVVLQQNGSARITETRQMSIDSEGTECYIVLDNMGGRQVSDYSVSDETGKDYESVGEWDIERSRDWKSGRYGVVTKRNGYELCWGLGESGSRTYTARYTVSDLLQGYDDADGFNWMFVAQGVSPYPDHVKLTIEGDEGIAFTPETAKIWGFRYRGDIRFEGDSISGFKIVAESGESFSSGSAMIVMACFDKGLFSPSIANAGSFEQVKERAFEGSDYSSEDEMTVKDWIILILMALGLFVVPIVAFIAYLIYVWRARKRVNKDLLWYRDIPMKGNLQQANDALNAYKYFGTDYNNLLSACILKLINMGAISITKRQNEKGKLVEDFEIHDLPNLEKQPLLLRKVHNIFKQAAGNDSILEPKELKSYMRSSYNQSVTDSFIQTLHTKTSIYRYKEHQEDVRQLFGLRKFLKEFTLIDERGIKEVGLWKDYIIYATLFGIADQVIRDMKSINPEFFKMDQVAGQMADEMTLPMIYSTMHSSTTRAAMSKAEREARASGGGGHSSWRGGGGFSGGGFGGGVR